MTAHTACHRPCSAVLLGVAALLAALVLAPGLAGAVGPPAPSWEQAIAILPPSATRSGIADDVSFIHEDPEGWAARVRDRHLKPGASLPAVVFLHGCNGPGTALSWGSQFTAAGFAFFAPNSFAREDRESLCATGNMGYRAMLRNHEMEYALERLRAIDWIETDRLVLAGFSEGAQAASRYDGDDFTAVVLIGTNCRHSGGRPRVSSSVAVLNMVGDGDHYGYGDGCTIGRQTRGSRLLVVKGQGHDLVSVAEAEGALRGFLVECCGAPRPQSAAAAHGPPGSAAAALMAEYGGFATMQARLDKDEAVASGDETAAAYWDQVIRIIEQREAN